MGGQRACNNRNRKRRPQRLFVCVCVFVGLQNFVHSNANIGPAEWILRSVFPQCAWILQGGFCKDFVEDFPLDGSGVVLSFLSRDGGPQEISTDNFTENL